MGQDSARTLPGGRETRKTTARNLRGTREPKTVAASVLAIKLAEILEKASSELADRTRDNKNHRDMAAIKRLTINENRGTNQIRTLSSIGVQSQKKTFREVCGH